jgi:hypothetical protein
LHAGTLFIHVYLWLAPGITLLIAWRTVRRAVRDPSHRRTILAGGAAALILWVGATFLMQLAVFGMAWSLAHTRPLPPGFFPEGWPIYGALTAYAAAGVSLALALDWLSRRKASV